MRTWPLYLLIVGLFLSCGCGDVRRESLVEAMRLTTEVLRQPEVTKLAETQKGTPAERRVAAFFSREGQKLWPPRADQEFSFARPTPGKWPPRIILLDTPSAPWSVVVTPEGENKIRLSGYGITLDKALLTQQVDL